MNKNRLTELAEWLEAGAPHVENTFSGIPVVGFDYTCGIGADTHDSDGNACGTVCCIAGAAVQFWGDADGFLTPERIAVELHDPDGDDFTEVDWTSTAYAAAEALGLDGTTASVLFTGKESARADATDRVVGDLQHWTSAQAARVIRHLIATGEVDWSQAGDS